MTEPAFRPSSVLVPLAAAALGLTGAAGVTAYLYTAGRSAVGRVLEARLSGAGESAASLLTAAPPTPGLLASVMKANALDGAYLVDRSLKVSADATGEPRAHIDLLRTDADRVAASLEGRSSVSSSYRLGELEVMSGYFPVRDPSGEVRSVLVLEGGSSFVEPQAELRRAAVVGGALSVLVAAMLAVAAWRYARFERERREALARAARGETVGKMAAIAAHEIRNPLSVMRATIDLMRERPVDERTRESLGDLLGEVHRLQRLTEDLLDLSADRPLHLSWVSLASVMEEAAKAAEARWKEIRVRREWAELPLVEADARRLHQVFTNLLANAAQAQKRGEIALFARAVDGQVVATIADEGPGVPEEIRANLFDLFVTTKAGGTGLGLALSRRLVERHGGTLRLLPSERGATFEVRLPVRGADA